MISFACPHCGNALNVKDELAGRRGKCSKCGERIQVPSASASPSPAQSPAPPGPRPALPRSQVIRAPQPSHPPAPVRPEPVSAPYGSSPVAIQVNVDQSRAANSLGIASLVLGILAFFVCWMPFIGLGFGGLGLLLGVGGLVLAITRKGSGIGFSIAGTAISSVATLVGLVFMTGLFGMFSAIDEAANRPPTVAIPVSVASADDNGGGESAATPPPAGKSGEPGATPSDGSSVAPRPAEAKEPAWPIADQAQQLGNVQVAITSVTIGKVPVRQMFRDTDSESEEDLLLIRLTVTNISERKKIDYRGWMSSYASLLDVDAELTDDVDNRYRKVNFGSTATIKDTETNTSLYPGKSINDAVVFELPIEGVKYLRLKLSAKGCGEEGEFRFQIPAAMIQRG